MRRSTNPAEAAAALAAGSLVALPTETVYGLGGLASSRASVRRIFQAKGRPVDHPLIVHVADLAAASYWSAGLPPDAVTLMTAFWPGPLTVVVNRAPHVLDEVTGGQPTVALRAPRNDLFQAVLAELRSTANPFPGIAAPSANRFGRVSPTTADHVVDELGNYLAETDVVLDGGACTVGVESTIVICRSEGVVLARSGAITREQLDGYVTVIDAPNDPHHSAGAITVTPGIDAPPNDQSSPSHQQDLPRVPGSLASHYAPNARVHLVEGGPDLLAELATLRPDLLGVNRPPSGVAHHPRVGVLGMASAVATIPDVQNGSWQLLLTAESVDQYAFELYAALRAADDQSIDTVVAVLPPATGVGLAVRDRLTRASVR